MSDPAFNLPGDNLASSEICLSTMLERRDRTSVLFTWKIQDYSRLRKNVLYWRTVFGTEHSFRFRLVKAGGTLFTALSTSSASSNVHFLLISKKKQIQIQGSTTWEVSFGLYAAEFCRKAVERPGFLEDDQLIVLCRYETKPDEGRILMLPYGQSRDSADVFQLCDDFRNLYIMLKRYGDFVVECETRTFRVHKAVLVARSLYFRELFEEDGGMSRLCLFVDATPRALDHVLLYLYSGEFSPSLDAADVLAMLRVASKWQVKCLKHKCTLFLESCLTPEIAQDVLTTANTFKIKRLKNAARAILVSKS